MLVSLRQLDLLEELEFHLVVHHPYKALVQFTGSEGMRRDGMLKIDDTSLQMAWYASAR